MYPSVMQCLHSHAPLEVKYAACCIVRTLARDSGFAARIKMENLFLLRQLREASARMKVGFRTLIPVGLLLCVCGGEGGGRVCVCVCKSMYVYVCVCMRVYAHMNAHTRMRVCVCVCVAL